MKRTIQLITATLALMMSVSAFAIDMTPQKLRKITPDTTLYNSQQVDVLMQNAGQVQKIIAGTNVEVSPATGKGNVTISVPNIVTKKRIAMFIIPMNLTASDTPTTAFKHFELKASYNNFDPTKRDVDRCCYYTHSTHADIAGIADNDKAKIYVNHGGEDQRSYVKVLNTLEYLTDYAPESYIVLVDVDCCWTQRSSGEWLNSEDDNLMWTFVKTMNDEREIDPGTGHPLWRPIAPVRWFKELPNWAR